MGTLTSFVAMDGIARAFGWVWVEFGWTTKERSRFKVSARVVKVVMWMTENPLTVALTIELDGVSSSVKGVLAIGCSIGGSGHAWLLPVMPAPDQMQDSESEKLDRTSTDWIR
ncbi:hypothetical protein GN244_ATG10646 [Phytophthora infestans]|nr:hypothetical protein GN244_ATG10646 [Phytophthora infestans]